jgi:hypothetical protein
MHPETMWQLALQRRDERLARAAEATQARTTRGDRPRGDRPGPAGRRGRRRWFRPPG